MINELREFEEYCEINQTKTPRIWYTTFTKSNKNSGPKCNGISRILTIIARDYLYTKHNYTSIDQSIKKQRTALREETKCYLQEWVLNTLTEFCDPYPDSDNLKEDEKKAKETIIQSIKDKNTYWSSKSLYSALYSGKNTINAINYDVIIADAINQGPLRNLCLVLKKEAFDNISYYIIKGKEASKTQKLDPQERSEIYYRLLKYIAATIPSLYGYNEPNRFVDVNNVDLSYWTQYAALASSNKKTVYLYKDMPLIETDLTKKCRINPDFFHSYNVQLMPFDEAVAKKEDPSYQGYLFFEDTGITNMKEL